MVAGEVLQNYSTKPPFGERITELTVPETKSIQENGKIILISQDNSIHYLCSLKKKWI